MIGILIVTHGRFGEELLSTARNICGAQTAVEAVGIMQNESREVLSERIHSAIAKMPADSGLLIFTDMIGGTPCNTCLPLARNAEIEVITGVNLNMLISAFAHRPHLNRFELIQKVAEDGRRAIVNAKEIFLKKCP